MTTTENIFSALRYERTLSSIDGIDLIEDIGMVDVIEDWSKVRSPSRARRRMRRGYRQNVVRTVTPKPNFYRLPNGTLVAHPEMVAQLRQRMGDAMQRKSDEIVRNALIGATA